MVRTHDAAHCWRVESLFNCSSRRVGVSRVTLPIVIRAITLPSRGGTSRSTRLPVNMFGSRACRGTAADQRVVYLYCVCVYVCLCSCVWCVDDRPFKILVIRRHMAAIVKSMVDLNWFGGIGRECGKFLYSVNSNISIIQPSGN